MMSDLFHNNRVNDFFYNIPDAILAEILKTLPVKSLLRCMCIQKSWYRLIRTCDFIKLHFNYHHHKNITTTTPHNNDLPKYLLFRWINSKLLGLRYDDEHCKEFHTLEVPPVIRLGERTFWLATSCSLICVSTISYNLYGHDEGNMYLWNPLIQKCKTLPLLDLSIFQTSLTWTALAFGYVPPINDFQVVRLVSYDSNRSPSILICVYSLNTNSWKTKTIQDNIFVHISDGYDSVSVNGISCWRAYNKLENGKLDTVLYFDTLKDVLRTISLPDHQVVYYNHSVLHQYDQSVALFVHGKHLNALNMWVLKQDSINDFFWEKMVSVRLGGHLAKAVILGSRNNGELIFSKFFEPDLVSYNPETRKAKDFFSSWKRWITLKPYDLYYQSPLFIVHPFVAGLVLLDTD